MDVLVFGLICLDHRVLCPLYAPSVIATDSAGTLGGSGALQALAAAQSGAETAFVGRIGTDAHGKTLQRGLKAAGIDTTGVIPTIGESAVSLTRIGPDGGQQRTLLPGVGLAATGSEVTPDNDLSVCLVQTDLPDAANVDMLEALAKWTRVILHLNTDATLSEDVMDRVDLLITDPAQAARLAPGHSSPQESAEALQISTGAEVILILGNGGCIVADDEGLAEIPNAIPDVDAFCGALSAALANRAHLRDAVLTAQTFAAKT